MKNLIEQNGGYITRKQIIGNRYLYYQLLESVKSGEIIRLKPGVYCIEDVMAHTMIDLDKIIPEGVLCLYSAWVHYELTTQIPQGFYVAIPRKRKVTLPDYPPIILNYWDSSTYATGIKREQELEYPLLLDDLPPVNIMAYSLETVVAEKFQAMIELSENNSRMKDFYDLYISLYDKTIDDILLEKAIHATLKNRGTVYEEDHPLFSDDFSTNLRFQMLWKGFMKKIGKTDPDFEMIIHLIKEKLFPFWEKYKGQ